MTEIRLLTRNPDYTKLPSGQADTYRLLLELGEGSYSLKDIIRQCNFRSPLPFWSRVRHLETRGLLRMTPSTEQPASTVKA